MAPAVIDRTYPCLGPMVRACVIGCGGEPALLVDWRENVIEADQGTRVGKDRATDAAPVLKVHHLNDSQSQKMLWLFEELGCVSFVAKLAKAFASIGDYPEIIAWLGRLHTRPGFQASSIKGRYIYGA